jgi:nitrate reductase molybdenum cofactor assembly chaperone NarJ/NarW
MADSMQILSVISRLLDYPSQDIQTYESDILDLISEAEKEHKLGKSLSTRLRTFVQTHAAKELMEWQSEYDGLFERGRSLALWLFEHVHGESRDRGQAMVDLVATYREAGLEISQHELPDYIPLFLEFLATQGKQNAQAWLQDVEHILGLLQCRLERRESDYAVLFEAMLTIANSKLKLEEIRAQIASEKRDDTKAAMDKEWEEEEVTFGAESLEKSCGTAVRKPSEQQRRDLDIPINWVDFDTSAQTASNAVDAASNTSANSPVRGA